MLRFFPVMIAFAVLAACSDAPTETALEPIPGFRAAPATAPETLNWLDLLPDGEYERLTALMASDVRPGLPLNHDESGPAAEQIVGARQSWPDESVTGEANPLPSPRLQRMLPPFGPSEAQTTNTSPSRAATSGERSWLPCALR